MQITAGRMDQILAMNTIHVAIGIMDMAVSECLDELPEDLQKELQEISDKLGRFEIKLSENVYEGRDCICMEEE